MRFCWTPEIPIIYVNNPKCGCSTIRHSLKAAQAERYCKSGVAFRRDEHPHGADDCLKTKKLQRSACSQRHLISCIRNPFTRALSAYLDKVEQKDLAHIPELNNRPNSCFEDFLAALADFPPRDINPHFRPQHFILNFPNITYDAIFFLENLAPLVNFVRRISPEFRLVRFAPHSQSTISRLDDYYTELCDCACSEALCDGFLAIRLQREAK